VNTLITLILIAVVFFYVINIYNTLVTLKNRFQNAFAQIEIQLKRRYDLIPNLVEIAKGYLKHERETLEAVIQARNSASALLQAAAKNPDIGSMQKLAAAEGQLAGAMGRLNVVMEAYPDLKANQNMMQLTEELTTTENKVSFSRQSYNDSVMEYNTYRQMFPANIFANMFGHMRDAELLEFEDSKLIQAAPKVSF